MQKTKVFTQHFDKFEVPYDKECRWEDHRIPYDEVPYDEEYQWKDHRIPYDEEPTTVEYQWEDHKDTGHQSAFDAFTHIAEHFAKKGVRKITVTVTDQDDERVQMFFEGTDTAIEITVYK